MNGLGIESWEDLERLTKSGIPEGPSLEYKRELTLDTDGQKVEFLKDVSGMGNGGGGALLFGVEEDDGNVGIPQALRPLEDRGLVGSAEDIMRSAVRPTLLTDVRVLDAPEGFVLMIEVARSPLGPYMVESYDDRRYYMRQGTRTFPMTEQQVRDAYALAIRGREGRAAAWERHSLPIRPESEAPGRRSALRQRWPTTCACCGTQPTLSWGAPETS